MVLVPVCEPESSSHNKENDAPGPAHNCQHHDSSSDDSSWKMESDLESNSSPGMLSFEVVGEPAAPVVQVDSNYGHEEEEKEEAKGEGKRGRADVGLIKRYMLRPRNSDGICRVESDQLGKGKINQASTTKKEETFRKFSVALSQEEIASDILAITGKKPSSRPPKRDKKLQQILNNLSPGFWLHTITPRSYN